MNGNYEWNKQFSRQKIQQRYQEAELYRQAKRQHQEIQAGEDSFLRAMLGKAIILLQKTRGLSWAVMARRMRQTWL